MTLLLNRETGHAIGNGTTPEDPDTGLRALCAEWQERLRLLDWDVEIKHVRVHDFDHSGVAGDCDTLAVKQVAKIRVVRPEDAHPTPMCPFDEEVIVVHELLHIHLKGWKVEYDTPAEDAKEVAVHRLSEALVKLKRTAGR